MCPFIAEIVGTALLVFLGNGVVANCVLKNTKTGGGDWMIITTAWAFAVFIGVVVAGPSSGAHLNPAVTIGLAAAGKFAWSSVPTYLIGELLGGMLGGLGVYMFFIDHFKITDDEGAKRACFSTEPAIRNTKTNFMNEAVGTFVLVFVIFFIASKGNIILTPSQAATPVGLGSIGALPVAILVWVIGLSLGGTTGYAINPARDAGPRIILTFLNGGMKTEGIKNLSQKFSKLVGNDLKVNPDWDYGWIPVAAPIAGAVVAAIIFRIVT